MEIRRGLAGSCMLHFGDFRQSDNSLCLCEERSAAPLCRSLPDGRREFTVEGSGVLTRPAILYVNGLTRPLCTERFERSTVFLFDLAGGQFMSQWVRTTYNPDVAR